jgi:hypothetical protein
MNWNPTENGFLTTYHSSFTVTGGCWFTVAKSSPLWNVNKDIASTNVKTGFWGMVSPHLCLLATVFRVS